MLSLLQAWKGKVEVNGQVFEDIHSVSPKMLAGNDLHIKLVPAGNSNSSHLPASKPESSTDTVVNKQYKITVKAYMTRKAEPNFDFMAKWNNDNPMPLRTMVGTVVKETRGMVYMHLHGAGQEEIHCMRCGRSLTHPVSRHYGIGPECMQKLGIIADIDDIENIKEQLTTVEWEGWVIKSAIIEQEEV